MAKKGERYECGTCGLVMLVEDPCSCEPCNVVCCEAPMKKAVTKPKVKK